VKVKLMKRIVALIAVLMLVGAACGDSGDSGSGGGGDIASVDDCDGLVGEAIGMLQDVLDALSDLSIEDIAALGDDQPDAITDLEQRGQELEAKSIELDCDEEELSAGVIARVDELEAGGPFAELILEGLKSDPDVFGS
jgi:hypothetical protein